MPLKHGNHDCHSFPYKVIQRKRCFFLKIKTVVHKLLTCESHKGREVQIHSHETPEGKPCQIIPPYQLWICLRMLISNHINHLHTGGPLYTKSLDQAWGHQASRCSFPCPPPTLVTKRHVPVTYIYFTFVNVFIIFTTTSRTGSALLSALWKAPGVHNQPYKPCSGEG